MAKKIKKISLGNSVQKRQLTRTIENLTKGLVYVSETDAPFEVFIVVGTEEFYGGLEKEDRPVEEISVDKFFARLVKNQDWHGDKEKEMARKFLKLKDFLDSNLNNLRVFRIGRVQIEIYVVGLDEDSRLVGIKTKATET